MAKIRYYFPAIFIKTTRRYYYNIGGAVLQLQTQVLPKQTTTIVQKLVNKPLCFFASICIIQTATKQETVTK